MTRVKRSVHARKKHLDPTQAHLNHVHIGMSKKGARAQTSFWQATLG